MNAITTLRTMAGALLALLAIGSLHAMTSLPHGGVMAAHSGKCLAIEAASSHPGARVTQASCRQGPNDQWQIQPIGGAYRLTVLGTGQCLTVAGRSMSAGAQIVQSPCVDSREQRWMLVPRGAGHALRSDGGNLCADIASAGQADGSPLILWRCNNVANQIFHFQRRAFVGEAPMSIVAQQSGQCLYGRTPPRPGAQAVQWPCGGTPDSSWTLRPVGTRVMIVNRQSNMCLDAGEAGQAAGGRVVENPCTGASDQRWRLRAFEGRWRLIAGHSGQCLSVIGPGTAAGAGLVQLPCDGKPNERWTMTVPRQKARWSAVIPTEIITAAAANLPDGRILGWAAYARNDTTTVPMGHTWTELLDPVQGTGSASDVINTRHDMFCPGTALLADGRLLVNGGGDSKRTSFYDPATRAWTVGAEMNIGRGYQGTAMRADGSVLTLGGSWSGGNPGNRIGELWTGNAAGWRVLPSVLAAPVSTADQQGVYRGDNHLWLHVLGGGRLLHAGPSKQMNWIDPNANEGRGRIWSAGLRGDDADSMNGNSLQYDVGKILKVGGSPSYGYDNIGFNATASALVIDANGPTLDVRRVAPMAYARAFVNSVVLPSGQVLVVGGQTVARLFSDANAVLAPELWDPDARIFERLPAMVTPRTYHSVALLLPDGRVWVAGGGMCGSCSVNHTNYEIITPPYLLNDDGTAAVRPAITVLDTPVVPVGGTLRASTGTPVSSFALVRLSAVTHSVNNDQRRIPLPASTPDGQHYEMQLPADAGVVLPGNYMLFALNARGVPSMARTVRIAPR